MTEKKEGERNKRSNSACDMKAKELSRDDG